MPAERSDHGVPPRYGRPAVLEELRFSDGEIHYLWHFIQGSIMVPDTRIRLRRAWGMCERHSFGFLAVEAAFKDDFLHGAAVLYEDLMERTRARITGRGPLSQPLVGRRLRAIGPCPMCEMGYGPRTRGIGNPAMLEQGRQLRNIRAFARSTEPGWRTLVCGRCAGSEDTPRCRVHLRDELARGVADLDAQRAQVRWIAEHISRYARSFRWEDRGTDTPEDRSALIGAVGWCSGWRHWLVLCG